MGKHEAGTQRDFGNNSNIGLKLFHLCFGKIAPETEVSPDLGSSQWIHCAEYWYVCVRSCLKSAVRGELTDTIHEVSYVNHISKTDANV